MKRIFLLFSLILASCASNPVSYLPSGTKPIVNVEEDINAQIDVQATADNLSVQNLTEQSLNIVYKLFWYDVDGITQLSDEQWQNLWLEPQQLRQVPLHKPTAESANYRVYWRNHR